MIIKPEDTLASIVSRNINAATVLNQHGVDFFSKGNRSLDIACVEDNTPMSLILEDLWELKNNCVSSSDFQNMSLIELSIYILKTHHRFAEKKVTFIKNTLARLSIESDGAKTPIGQLQSLFNDLSLYLTVHMKHEELVVFPFIHKLAKGTFDYKALPLQIIQPIESMQQDHFHEVDTLRRLAQLTKNYSVGIECDYALKITYDAMRELENDLKIHMHLENNILFPNALKLAHSHANTLN